MFYKRQMVVVPAVLYVLTSLQSASVLSCFHLHRLRGGTDDWQPCFIDIPASPSYFKIRLIQGLSLVVLWSGVVESRSSCQPSVTNLLFMDVITVSGRIRSVMCKLYLILQPWWTHVTVVSVKRCMRTVYKRSVFYVPCKPGLLSLTSTRHV